MTIKLIRSQPIEKGGAGRLFYVSQVALMFNTDNEGFLIDPDDWNREFAQTVADQEGLLLTEDHWQLIELTRQFHAEYGFSPSMRPLVKFIGMKLGLDKAKSLYLMKLFPPSPAKLLSKYAGLHKPKNCL